MPNRFLYSEFPDRAPETARFHIIPVPLEASVSYGRGTASGPQAILDASGQLETLVEGYGEPGLFGIHTFPAIDCHEPVVVSEVFRKTAERMLESWDCAAVPILLGGEHSITNGAIEAIVRRYPAHEVGIIQFDAHMDLRDCYEGNRYSHATVMHRAVEKGIRLHQVGIRNYSTEELAVRERHAVSHCDASQIHRMRSVKELPVEMSLPDDFPTLVYISFDVDGFDASLMSATGTPDPGGFWWWEAVEMLGALTEGRRVLGADVVELAPQPQLHHCDYVAAKLTYLLMGIIAQRNRFPHDRTFS